MMTPNRHCERSEAIQNDLSALDWFVAEPVIGPATSGRTRWLLAMTRTGGLVTSRRTPLRLSLTPDSGGGQLELVNQVGA